ncbi:MAG: HNH endonuclease [Archaeoglobus sp.]|nr:HNH endonuclease [Archaeoglobus sp.]
MPRRPKKPCSYPGCPELVEAGERYCLKHKRQHQRQYDQQRGTAAQRGYDARWRRARKRFLAENPLCVECMKEGRLTPATVVDHIVPHKGNYELFWDESNWQPLCKRCHDKKTAREDGGFANVRT